MRVRVRELIAVAHASGRSDGIFVDRDIPSIIVEKPKSEEFGDFSTNLAMLLAPIEKKKPRDIAVLLTERISADERVEKCEIAGPGFINIFLKESYWTGLLSEIIELGPDFGKHESNGKRVQVEFVSANPTGPLHIGHARGAAVGDALCRVLEAAGFDVTREFYINDAGMQVVRLGESVELRRRELNGEKIELGENHYKGDYIIDIARAYQKALDDSKSDPSPEAARDFAVQAMLGIIKGDLAAFGVEFDTWQSERDLDAKIIDAIDELKDKGHVKNEDGAVWLKTEALGDDKDRVLEKANGERTYFASDIAYHREKIRQGFDQIVDIWGADHHGYEARVRAAMQALGFDDSLFSVIFIQMVSLLRDGKPVQMGKRSGDFVSLKQVLDEVGSDACRFFFLMRKSDAQLDFDLELAKKEASENPVYYVQYCHARICSLIAHAADKGAVISKAPNDQLLKNLVSRDDLDLIKRLSLFEDVIIKSSEVMEPHRVTYYLQELAGAFHSYYNKNRVVSDDPDLTGARLQLCGAVKTVIRNGLTILGVSTPEKM